MIANISPCFSAHEHTLNTLRYADRVKELKGDEHDPAPRSRADSVTSTDVSRPPKNPKAGVVKRPSYKSNVLKIQTFERNFIHPLARKTAVEG